VSTNVDLVHFFARALGRVVMFFSFYNRSSLECEDKIGFGTLKLAQVKIIYI
jgi:hypothetical protein